MKAASAVNDLIWGAMALLLIPLGVAAPLAMVAMLVFGERAERIFWWLVGIPIHLALGVMIALALVVLVAPPLVLVLSLAVRGHPFGYGWEGLASGLLVRFRVVSSPAGRVKEQRVTVHIPCWKPALRHSYFYNSDECIKMIIAWFHKPEA